MPQPHDSSQTARIYAKRHQTAEKAARPNAQAARNQNEIPTMNSNDSNKRTEANRQNSQKSTGPRTTVSTRFNAVKHGLLAEGVTELDGPEAFLEFRAKLEAELKPVGELEGFLTRRIALCMVRWKRVELLEAEYTTAKLNPAITKGGGFDLASIGIEEIKVVDPGLPARVGTETVATLANLFSRYETAIENRLYRAMNQLERLQRLRRGDRVAAPVSVDIAVHGENPPLASFGNHDIQ